MKKLPPHQTNLVINRVTKKHKDVFLALAEIHNLDRAKMFGQMLSHYLTATVDHLAQYPDTDMATLELIQNASQTLTQAG